MLFKYFPWEFENNVNINFYDNKVCLWSFFCSNPLLHKIGTDYILLNITKQSYFHERISGGALTTDIVETNIFSKDLFSDNKILIISESEEINKKTFEYIINKKSKIIDNSIILLFSKNCPNRKKLIQNSDNWNHLELKMPRFWEMPKLLDYFTKKIEIKISIDVKNYILNSINNNPYDLYNVINLLSNYFEQAKTISDLNKIKEILGITKIDFFTLGKLFANRKFNVFFDELLKVEIDYDQFAAFFRFMQGHLIKIFDTSYLNNKTKLAKYDKEISECSKNWKKSEIHRALKMFADFEIMSKSKDPILKHNIMIRRLKITD